MNQASSTDLSEDLRRDVWLSVEEVQHVARVLDAVFGRLLRRGEAVVPGAVEVFEAARAVLQLIALTGDNGLLLGHTTGKEKSHFKYKRHQEKLHFVFVSHHYTISSSSRLSGLTPTLALVSR